MRHSTSTSCKSSVASTTMVNRFFARPYACDLPKLSASMCSRSSLCFSVTLFGSSATCSSLRWRRFSQSSNTYDTPMNPSTVAKWFILP